MQVSSPVRYGILSLVAVLAAGLVWLGLVRYQAEQRALMFAEPEVNADLGLGKTDTPHSPSTAPAPTPPAPEPPKPKLIVHVTGAVVKPGVYTLEQGARIADAVAAAGGALPDGAPDALNLAAPVSDGDKIYVSSRKELEGKEAPSVAAQGATRLPVASESGATTASTTAGRKVNINTATAKELEKVPGIGPATAKAIVDYRSSKGPFKRVDDLDAVKGIGPATLAKLRDHLTV